MVVLREEHDRSGRPGEGFAEFVRRYRMEKVTKAQVQKRRLSVVRNAMRLGVIDDLQLVRGNLNEYEPIIANWEVRMAVRACREIGHTRAVQVLSAAGISATTPMRRLSYAQRAELADLIHEARYG